MDLVNTLVEIVSLDGPGVPTPLRKQIAQAKQILYRLTHEPLERPEHLEARARDFADMLRGALPPTVLFGLFLFTFGENGSLAYISTADREDMISVIREWLAKQQQIGTVQDESLRERVSRVIDGWWERIRPAPLTDGRAVLADQIVTALTEEPLDTQVMERARTLFVAHETAVAEAQGFKLHPGSVTKAWLALGPDEKDIWKRVARASFPGV